MKRESFATQTTIHDNLEKGSKASIHVTMILRTPPEDPSAHLCTLNLLLYLLHLFSKVHSLSFFCIPMKNVFSFIVLLLLQALIFSITQAADEASSTTTTTANVQEEASSSNLSSAQFWGQIIAIIALVVCSGIVAGMIKSWAHCPTLMSHGVETHDDPYTPSSLRMYVCRIDTWFGKWFHLTFFPTWARCSLFLSLSCKLQQGKKGGMVDFNVITIIAVTQMDVLLLLVNGTRCLKMSPISPYYLQLVRPNNGNMLHASCLSAKTAICS